jgi:hypothetical protein
MNAEPLRHDGSRWSCKRWLILIALVFAGHIGLVFIFGERKPISPRTVENVPTLQLADNANELLAIRDPSLFASPRPEDFAGPAWLQSPRVEFHRLEWTEPPRLLQLSANELGNVFNEFMRTNQFVEFQLELKPQPELTAPEYLPIEPIAENSTLQIQGELAQRQLLNQINLPSLQYDDVIAPSRVQVIVDAAGNVVSAVLLPSDNVMEAASHYDVADQRALELTRNLRFSPSSSGGAGVLFNPASRLTFGQLIFNWRTVPVSATNAPAVSP